MLQKLLNLVICVVLSGVITHCASTPKPEKPKESPTWSLLKNVPEVACESLPIRETDLDYQKIEYSSAIESLLVKARSRKGRAVYYRLPYTAFGAPDLQLIQPLKVSNEETLIGAGQVYKSPYIALGKNVETDSKISIKMPTEVGTTLATGAPPHAIEDISFSPGDGGFWTLSKQMEFVEEPSALDDRPSQIHFFKVQKNTIASRSFNFQMVGRTQLLTYNQKHAVAIWLDEGTSSQPKPGKFKMRLVSSKGAFSPEVALTDNAKRVEQWSAVATKDGVLLATIEGDSVMGEANLKVSKIVLGAKGVQIAWQKTKSLTNEHVGDPVWITHKNSVYIYLPKWLDSESTLSLYRVTDKDVSSIGSVGIFSEGTTFQSIFTLKDGAVVALSTTMKGNVAQYLLCEVTPPAKH
jgi:hypothetical protein